MITFKPYHILVSVVGVVQFLTVMRVYEVIVVGGGKQGWDERLFNVLYW